MWTDTDQLDKPTKKFIDEDMLVLYGHKTYEKNCFGYISFLDKYT